MMGASSNGKAVIFSAPSGSGKTTIIGRVRERFPQLQFSVSACSRAPRPGEEEGKAYYFLSPEEFQRRVAAGEFLEWEEVYTGMYYGTLREEVQRIWSAGQVVLFDVDVKGALNLKRELGGGALTLFIAPPSLEVLRSRLEHRGTETPESLSRRIARAGMEMGYANRFDRVVVNDDLSVAVDETVAIIGAFLG